MDGRTRDLFWEGKGKKRRRFEIESNRIDCSSRGGDGVGDDQSGGREEITVAVAAPTSLP
jgi:hypothetical protein